jgi:hypothetical protein
MEPERIRGTKMIELFRHLAASKTIISMLIVGSGFERLTCVTDVKEDGKQTQIVVDLPSGFKEVAENQKSLKLNFNFNGPDNLEYLFAIQGGNYTDNGLRLSLPDYVERLQRRKDFRMQVPIGTQMHFQIKQLQGTVDLINISLGGAFGELRAKSRTLSNSPVFKLQQPVFKIRLVFPGQDFKKEQAVSIQKAEVVRIEKGEKKHRYAFKFKYMSNDEKQKLTEHIYRIQREYLQRR